MNKKEYMDILTDYLSDSVTSEEKQEILRDVEEMIEDGKLSGYSEESVVSKLGSPKELVREIKGDDFEIIEDSIINKKELDRKLDKIKKSSNNVWEKCKEKFTKTKENLLNKEKVTVGTKIENDEFDLDFDKEFKERIKREQVSRKRNRSRIGITFKIILNLGLLIFASMIILPFGASILAFIVAGIIFIGLFIGGAIVISSVNTPLVFTFIFSIMIVIGGILILFSLFRWLLGVLKLIFNNLKGNFI
ncbi:MAG: DUF1700 domain-containing protein [Sarcina sp.]